MNTRAARRLRPVATERAREAQFRPGDEVFVGGIAWGRATIARIYDGKPYRVALFMGRSAGFFGSLAYVYRTEAEYQASGVHWSGPPK